MRTHKYKTYISNSFTTVYRIVSHLQHFFYKEIIVNFLEGFTCKIGSAHDSHACRNAIAFGDRLCLFIARFSVLLHVHIILACGEKVCSKNYIYRM